MAKEHLGADSALVLALALSVGWSVRAIPYRKFNFIALRGNDQDDTSYGGIRPDEAGPQCWRSRKRRSGVIGLRWLSRFARAIPLDSHHPCTTRMCAECATLSHDRLHERELSRPRTAACSSAEAYYWPHFLFLAWNYIVRQSGLYVRPAVPRHYPMKTGPT